MFKGHRGCELDAETKSEYVQGLNTKETATLLNVDSGNAEMMKELFDTALHIKEVIYGNRIVLFAPLYLANYCVNTCTYCAYRAGNKSIARTVRQRARAPPRAPRARGAPACPR